MSTDTQTDSWRSRFLVSLVLVALALRVIVAVAVQQVAISSGGDGFFYNDDRNYDRVAWQQAQAWRGVGSGVPPEDRRLLNVYTYTEAGLYFLVGHHPLAMKLLNCLIGALTAGLVFLIGSRVFGHLAGMFAGIAAALFPSTFLWSTANLKDAMFLFAVALLLWLLTLLMETGRLRLIVPLLATLALVGGVRLYLQPALAMLMPGAVVLQTRASLPRKWLIAAFLLIGGAAVILLSGSAQYFGLSAGQLNDVRFRMASGAGSAFVSDDPTGDGIRLVSAGSVGELITWIPTGLTYVLAAPFPWAADRMIERITIPEVLIWYVAVVLALIAVARYWRNWRQYVHLLGYIGGVMLILSITQGNLGTLVRHRGMVIPFVLIFSGAGAAWLWSRWRATKPAALPFVAGPDAARPPAQYRRDRTNLAS